MLRRCTLGLLVVSLAVAVVGAWRGPRGAAQPEPPDIELAPAAAEPPLLKEKNPPLPVAKVVLFNSGVGYFQREGEVEGTAHVDLAFDVENVNDLIKSLVLEDLGGGSVMPLRYDSQEPIDLTLKSFALDLSTNPTFGQLLNQARGEVVEVSLQANGSLPNTLTGTILGMEASQPAGVAADGPKESLNLMCAEGLRSVPLNLVQRVRFLNPVMESELRRALEVVARAHDSLKKTVRLGFKGEGKRPVRVGYVIDNPIWKSSYRLVMDDNGKPTLQAWATVENTTDEDWKDVRVVLVSGRPISFQMDLYQPLFVPRPVVEPELFASLRPPTYNAPLIGPGQLGWQGGAAPALNTGFNFGGGFGGGVMGGIGQHGQNDPLLQEGVEPRAPIPTFLGQFGQFGWGQFGNLGGQFGLQGGFAQINPYQRPDAAFTANPRLSYQELQQRRQSQQKADPAQSRQLAKQLGSALAQIDPSVLESATAANLGLAGRFAVEEKLTLPRQQSAMIPLLKLPVEAERVSIYNESVQARHPLLGLRFKNPAAQALMQGPVTVFEGGEYAGDSRILDMQPGEERLLSYAVDLATEVEKTTRQEPGPKLLARVVNNTLEVQYTMRETATYLVRNRSGQDRRLIVEHPLRSDWKLVEPEKPAERSRDVYRFVVEVRAGETVKFEVAEEQPRRDPFQVTVTPTRTGFGTPLGIDVWVEGRPVTEETLGLELVQNDLHVSHHDRRRDHYFVRNRNDAARTVVLEHVFPEGRRFVEADRGPVMITTRFRRFELQIPAGKTAEVKVSHEAELPVSLALAPTLGGSKAPEGTPNFLPPPELLESLGFAAWVTRQAEPPRLTGATIEKGEVRVARVAKETITYHLENRAETNRTFVLDHRVRDGWRIVGDHKPAFGSAPRYRFEVKAGPKETARHEAAEEFRTTQAVALAKFDDETLKELTDSGVVSPAVKEALRKGVGMSRQLAQTQEALRRLEGRRTQVLEEQTRLRANLEKLPPDTPLYKRYLQKLDEEETALEQVRAQIAEQTRTEERQRRELEVFVDGLTVK